MGKCNSRLTRWNFLHHPFPQGQKNGTITPENLIEAATFSVYRDQEKENIVIEVFRRLMMKEEDIKQVKPILVPFME